MKCSQDPVYFIKTHMKIVNLNEGLVPFELYDFQEKFVNTIHNNRFVISKFPRQSGNSTTVISYFLHTFFGHCIMFHYDGSTVTSEVLDNGPVHAV